MQLEIVPFHPMHVALMELRQQERIYIEHLPDWDTRLRYMQVNGASFTALADGQVGASWGVIPMWAGVAEFWMLTSTLVEKHPTVCARVARTVIDSFATSEGSRRVQIAVNASDPRALRFADFLQFEREGVLRAYGPDGSDYIMMARINDGRTVRRRRRGAEGHDDAAACHAAGAAGQD